MTSTYSYLPIYTYTVTSIIAHMHTDILIQTIHITSSKSDTHREIRK